jgi:hypothetical protein
MSKRLAIAVGLVVLMALGLWGGACPAGAGEFPKMDVKLGHSGVLEMSYHKGSLCTCSRPTSSAARRTWWSR